MRPAFADLPHLPTDAPRRSAEPGETVGVSTFHTHRFVFYQQDADDTSKSGSGAPASTPREQVLEWQCDFEDGTRQIVTVKGK